ncbi:type IV pilus modification protein PilV [Rheinheimera maricola]|uniref:Type IV pilus modification protein PilV n=1 Tax=Rheinheimera maricola TaxID=2793282 RepID=A0ABS7XCQ1_9GAMM|nr:type IV pilus modification protein PilV [Rheinheimera maricola]MBZ9612537.1 type IV pilus modification protein PilV [Rheinheimera maricola]
MRLQHGFSLVEVLVTLVIFKIGLLGALLSQTIAIRQVQDATQRTISVALAQGLLNEMRANPQLSQVLGPRIDSDIALPSLPDCSVGASCTITDVAAVQAHSWLNQLQQYNRLSLQQPQFCLRSAATGVNLSTSWQQKSSAQSGVVADCAVGNGRSGFALQNGGH